MEHRPWNHKHDFARYTPLYVWRRFFFFFFGGGGRVAKLNKPQRQKIFGNVEFPAVGEAYKTVFWPTPRFTTESLIARIFCRRDLNLCVRDTQSWRKNREVNFAHISRCATVLLVYFEIVCVQDTESKLVGELTHLERMTRWFIPVTPSIRQTVEEEREGRKLSRCAYPKNII